MSRDHASRGPAVHGTPHRGSEDGAAAGAVGRRTLVEQVQRRTAPGADEAADGVKAAATHGISGPAVALPHGDRIQRLFGRHDVSGVRAHVGGAAAEGAAAMGAQAFATGDRIAFGQAPDLHTAAHEAAHVVQQRGGVQLKGGVGQTGDTYERHADAVADRVVQGESAESLLDSFSPGPGRAAAPAAGSPVQRLQALIGGQAQHITKADLSNDVAIDALFNRLGLVLPAKVEVSTYSRVNKIAAAIDFGSANSQIFLEVLGAINDRRPRDWSMWDAAEARAAAGPAPPSTLPGGTVDEALKQLVKDGEHQDAVNLLCQHHRPAAAVGYTIRVVDKFRLPGGQVIENDAYANVAAGTNVIDLSKRWTERFILSGQIGNLINVIEHEATHVRQNTGAPGVTTLADEDIREFEAYSHELELTIQRAAFESQGHVATSVEFEKALRTAGEHRDRAHGKRLLTSRHNARWDHIQAALPDTRARLAALDQRRNVYAMDRSILQTKLAAYHEMYLEMSGLFAGAQGAAERAETLNTNASAEDLQILQSLGRLPPAEEQRPQVIAFRRERETFLNYMRNWHHLPPPPHVQAPPTAVAGGSIPLLAPPPGDRQASQQASGGSIPLLAPPPGDQQAAAHDDDDDGDGWSAFVGAPQAPQKGGAQPPTDP